MPGTTGGADLASANGTGGQPAGEGISGLTGESESGNTAEAETEHLTEKETETGTEETLEELLEESLEEELELFADESLSPAGTLITEAGSGYTIVQQGDRTYSADYLSIRAHADSTISVWNHAGSSVKSGQFSTNGVRYGTYLLPQTKAAAGQFGFRVTNVAYDPVTQTHLDLLVTVSDFNDYTYSSTGIEVTDVYPYLGMYLTASGHIGFAFYNAFPSMEVRCDLVQSGTSTPVTGNYRVKMLDIDYWQRFGISLQGGSVTGKYALSGSVVYTESKSVFGHSYLLFQGCGDSGDDDPLQSVMYELSDTAGICLLFQNAYRDTKTTTSAATIRKRYQEALTGVATTHSLLDWDGTAYGPVEVSAPVKYVSNDNVSLSDHNELTQADAVYYYTVEHLVPEESSSYYYTSYLVEDLLPEGVDFTGQWNAVQVESGADVSDWFLLRESVDPKQLTLVATADARASEDFYSFHYRFTFQVRLNPGELSPVYRDDTVTYTVSNTASVTVQHSVDHTPLTLDTNTVTTTAVEERITQEAPLKRLEADEAVLDKEYEDTETPIVFSIYQTVPEEPLSWLPETLDLSDTLMDALIYESCQVSLKKKDAAEYEASDGWSIGCEGQTVTASCAYRPEFAGGVLRWDITCRIDSDAALEEWYQLEEGVTKLVLTNRAECGISWQQGEQARIVQRTNEVTVRVAVPELHIRLTKRNQDTGEVIPDAEFTVYEWDGAAYSDAIGTLQYDTEHQNYTLRNLARTSTNQGKFRIAETKVPKGYCGGWEQELTVPARGTRELELSVENPMATGTITIYKKSRQTGEPLQGAAYQITAAQDICSPEGKVLAKQGEVLELLQTDAQGKAVSSQLYPGTYLVTETEAPIGYALDAKAQKAIISYQNAKTPVTNTELTFRNDRLYGELSLTKHLQAEEIVWAHGTPVFTFKVEGTDVLGVAHTYYETVEFTRVRTASTGDVTQTVHLKVLAGTYVVSEEPTMRYALDHISDLSGGILLESGTEVSFDCSGGQAGAAGFYNRKTTDEDESHASLVRNHIIES